MSKKYTEYKGLNLTEAAKSIAKEWETNKTFEQSLKINEGNPAFIFYEGPPSANGQPGIHHVMARTIKDIFCRYKTLKGFRVDRKAGWDTHGLPVELGVEKKLGITKEDIGKTISVEEYNRECRSEVMKYKDLWDQLTVEMGYWVDLDSPYITFENKYIETLWWLLKQLYNKGLLYKGYTIQPYSPAAGTGLSSHELNQPGCYRDVKDTTIVGQFKVIRNQRSEFLFQDVETALYFLAWTTTPWTLPSNTALAVGSKITYLKIQSFNQYTDEPITVILAKDLFNNWFDSKNAELSLEEYKAGDKKIPFKILAEYTGSELVGVEYEQLLPWIKPMGNAFRVISGDYVTTEDGTGIVHIAPTFGADDNRVAKASGIAPLLLIDKEGKYQPMVDRTGKFFNINDLDDDFVKTYIDNNLYQNFAGKFVKNAYDPNLSEDDESLDLFIAVAMKRDNKAFRIEKYVHNYPHCWRTDKPVLYYPLDSWFIKTTAYKERIIELNKTINWKPQATGLGRFGNWLENMVDWNLSRSRYWGTPLPIWRTEDGKEEICIGSVEELKTEIDKSIKTGFMTTNPLENFIIGDNSKENYEKFDLHRPYADNIFLVSPSGKKMTRELDLIDVWFDSGAMPYAQFHYPFEHSPLNSPKGNLSQPIATIEAKHHYETINPVIYKLLKEHILQHRKNPNEAKIALWECLNGNLLKNYKFYREHIIDDIIVDFVCLSQKLVIEVVDKSSHDDPKIKELDLLKTEIINNNGFKVIWFTNDEVLHHTEKILDEILTVLQNPFLENLGNFFPADFIAEGVDQTRGWFYTLHVIAAMAFDNIAFKNCISNGLVLDKNGNKMSKRLNNTVNPFETIEKYGSDALRWYMITNAQPWDNLKFDINGVDEVRRKFFGTLYNTYSFFALYANIDGFSYKETDIPLEKRPEIDRWILSELNTLIKNVDRFYEDYEPTQSGRAIFDFVNDYLSNWYVRLCRRRFWHGEYTEDKISAYQTLYTCLETVAQLASPIAPFYCDRLFQDLNQVTQKQNAISVHLTKMPVANENMIESDLEIRMQLAQKICSLTLSLRKKHNIRVRQPLEKIMIPVSNDIQKKQIEAVKELILSEVNIKSIEYLTESSNKLVKKIKPNFKILGPKYGQMMKNIANIVAIMDQISIAELERNNSFNVNIENKNITLTLEDVEITTEDIPGWVVTTEGELTVALDVVITEPLYQEGIARDMVNRIQNLRKETGLEVTDKIRLTIEKREEIFNAINNNNAYICAETLIGELIWSEKLQGNEIHTVDISADIMVMLTIEKLS